MTRKGIISAGNWLLDTVKFIKTYPTAGNLITIERLSTGYGGSAHNVLVDLARMETDLPLYAGGCIGNDTAGNTVMDKITKLGIDTTNMFRTDLPTAYTDVMADMTHGTRTFFHYRGANALLDEDNIAKMNVPAKIFHLGYLLLLDRLDADDSQYGTKAARALHDLQQKGYLTSVDVVSEEGDRFRKIVLPSLPYIDYFIVNEVEAGACCEMNLRDKDGKINLGKVKAAAALLFKLGVGKVCAIHFPEGAYALASFGEECYEPSMGLPVAEIVSSVGAGDAFCAGTLYGLHEGMSLRDTLRIGGACAYFNLKSATSTDDAPTWDTIKDAINKKYSNLPI